MNELQIFQNPQFGEIRTITEDGVTLFCGADVATALGYKNPRKALADRWAIRNQVTLLLLIAGIPRNAVYHIHSPREKPLR